MECSTHGYTVHHVPRNSGCTGGGVGVLINDIEKNSCTFENNE